MQETRALSHEETWSLVQKVKAGDREAFVTLTRNHQQRVFVLSYAFFRNKEDALDLVQETFLRIFEKIHTFRRGRSFEAWLLQIARNLCIDAYRRDRGRRRELEAAKTVEELDVADPRQQGSEKSRDLREVLARGVDRLSERQRTIFILRHYNQLKNEEIAETLGISVGTVKSLHFKAVQNLRIFIGPYLGEET